MLILSLALLAGACKNDSTGPRTDADNLVTNSSFEANNKLSFIGWQFADTPSSAGSDDVPLLGGAVSLLMYPQPETTWARTFVSGESGRRIYELSVWGKTQNMSGSARITCGILQPDRSLRNQVHVNISATEWTYYTVQDTLNLDIVDTIVVELSPGISDGVTLDERVFFDLVQFQRVL